MPSSFGLRHGWALLRQLVLRRRFRCPAAFGAPSDQDFRLRLDLRLPVEKHH
jgi:hypothetical protein